MSGTVLSTLLFNQRLNKNQKARIFDLFQYNIKEFDSFLDKSDYVENEEKIKKMFSFDNEEFWDNVLKNYSSLSPIVAEFIINRLWEGFSFVEVDDTKWVDVIDDVLTGADYTEEYDAEGYYRWLSRWYENDKIFDDLNTSVWVGVIRRLKGENLIGEIIFYLCYDMFDESEKQEINNRLGYEGEEYDEQTDGYLPSGEVVDFKEYVDNNFGGIQPFIDSFG